MESRTGDEEASSTVGSSFYKGIVGVGRDARALKPKELVKHSHSKHSKNTPKNIKKSLSLPPLGCISLFVALR